MPGQPTSDAAFDLHRVCLHGIQFTFGIDLYLPGSGRQPPASKPPPRFRQITVASPAPKEGAWVAISFDRFTPPERSSADYLAQVQRCTVQTCAQFGT